MPVTRSFEIKVAGQQVTGCDVKEGPHQKIPRPLARDSATGKHVRQDHWQDLSRDDPSYNEHSTVIPSQIILHRLTAAIKGTAANLIEDIEMIVLFMVVHRIFALAIRSTSESKTDSQKAWGISMAY